MVVPHAGYDFYLEDSSSKRQVVFVVGYQMPLESFRRLQEAKSRLAK